MIHSVLRLLCIKISFGMYFISIIWYSHQHTHRYIYIYMIKIHIIYEWLLRTSPSMTQLSRASQNRCMLHNIVVPPNSLWVTQIYALMFDVHGTLLLVSNPKAWGHTTLPQNWLTGHSFVWVFQVRWRHHFPPDDLSHLVTSLEDWPRCLNFFPMTAKTYRSQTAGQDRSLKIVTPCDSKQVLKSCIFVRWSI